MTKRKELIPIYMPPGTYREYVPRKFINEVRKTIDAVNRIIGTYQAQGYDLTLRQVYYRLVAANLIANKDTEYKRLGETITAARRAGLVSWTAITDRTRNLRSFGGWESPDQIIKSSADGYARDRWEKQTHRLEVWIEKDALVGVVARACEAWGVPYFSCRGYTSDSEMWYAAQRLRGYAVDGLQPTIIHLGDHDPSGRDMTRDVFDRLQMFVGEIPVKRIALNMDQIEQYAPPPNPAKITDSRYGKYVDEFGEESWELDALEPTVINDLIVDEIKAVIDWRAWVAVEAREAEEKATIERVAEHWQLSASFAELLAVADDPQALYNAAYTAYDRPRPLAPPEYLI